MSWRDADTSAGMVARFVEERRLSGSSALAAFARALGVAGVRPDNTVRRWVNSGRCEIPSGLMRRALDSLERETAGRG